MRVRLFLLLVWFALAANADWPRMVITPKGADVDTPAAQPLKYFTEFPWLRDEDGDFCYLCKPEERLARAKAEKARADVKLVGKIGRFTVYHIFYYFGEDERPGWKSIIVQTGPNAYREIYHDQPNEGQPNPSFLVHAAKEPVLCVVDNVYRSDVEEHCFWFNGVGVVRIDFAPIWKAAQKVAPAGRRVWEYGVKAKTAFEKMVLPVALRYQDTGNCCDDKGVVNVHFRLDHGRVVVINAKFDPDGDYE